MLRQAQHKHPCLSSWKSAQADLACQLFRKNWDTDECKLNHGVTETLRKNLFDNSVTLCLGG